MVYIKKELSLTPEGKDIFSYFNINNYFFLFIIKMESYNEAKKWISTDLKRKGYS
jgi:hypothetical protein